MKAIRLAAVGVALLTGCATHEPPRALTQRQLANVTAFANALGYVRFFHPTDAVARVNWDAFAVRSIRVIESATSDDSLAASLSAVFAPITSNVQFARTGTPLATTLRAPAGATHVIFWRHLGVGHPGGSTELPALGSYRSERVVASLSEAGHPISLTTEYPIVSLPNVPDPSRPMIAALGGGVSMSMPIALFTDAHVVEESRREPYPARVMEHFPVDDRATRLAAVALAWSVFTHFYPYFDVVQADWPAALDAALRSAATDATDDAFHGTLERLVAALHDGHGSVRRRSVPRQRHDVELAWIEGQVLVTALGDSAKASGLRVGDEVLGVDGQPVQVRLDEMGTRTSGATPQWIRYREMHELLDGDLRTRAEVRVSGADGGARAVSLARTPGVAVKPRLDSIAELSPGVIYMDLERITDSTFEGAMPRLQRATTVIFDVRGWAISKPLAHLSDSVIHSAHFMTPVITEPNYRNVGFIDGAWNIAPAAPRLKAPAIFLAGAGDISGAESFLGVVESNRLGDIVGEQTAGTNGNVNPFTLPGGHTVWWTGMLVQKRDGSAHHGVGITPTVRVSPTIAGVRAGRDEVLERALALVAVRVSR